LFTLLQGGPGLFGTAAAVYILFILRLLVGAAESPSFPGNARLVAAWFPANERGTASAIFNSAQYFATALFGPVMGAIAFHFGWRSVFYFMGGLGILFSLVWLKTIYSPRPLREEAVCAGGGRRGPFLSGRVTLAQGTAA
jgi:ACS family glucarate transporter-like MFS transporter